MEELAVVRPRHVLCIDSPMCHLPVVGEYLAVILRTCDTGAGPVLRINEVSSLKCFLLIILYFCTLRECRIEFVTLWMRNDEIHVRCCNHPFSKRVWHSLRQAATMRCPCEYSLYTLLCLVLLYSNKVGKSL